MCDSQHELQGGEAIPIQHSINTGEMATLFADINSITDNFDRPTYSDPSELIQALQGLHLSEALEYDDDDADEEGQNDIDISRMQEGTDNKDYTMGGSEKLQNAITYLITKYDDIFSYSVKVRSMDVPPIEYTVDGKNWESSGNKMASRQISIEKQVALKTLIDQLLDKEVMRPLKAIAWSQVHFGKET